MPSQHSTGSGHLAGAGNTAGAVAGSNRLVMANLPTDNSNIAALAFNAAINNHVGLFTESFFLYSVCRQNKCTSAECSTQCAMTSSDDIFV